LALRKRVGFDGRAQISLSPSLTTFRIGTYNGHQGAVWDMDCNKPSTRLLTASADATCKLWNVETGEELKSFPHRGPVRGVAWAEGSNEFATISDPFMDNDALISIYTVPEKAPVEVRRSEGSKELSDGRREATAKVTCRLPI